MAEEAVYRIEVEPISERVQVAMGGATVADSAAAKVMHETSLPSHPYFPKSDVTDGVLEPSTLRTFCPFKGTAHYWNLRLPIGTINNGAWSYEAPLEEAIPVAGHVAFDPKYIDELSGVSDPTAVDVVPMDSNPLVDWLMTKASRYTTPEELTYHFAEAMIAMGMPVWRLNIGFRTLHPVLVARQYTWTREQGGIVQNDALPEMLQDPAYLNSPIVHVRSGLGGVRQRLDAETPEFQFPIMDDLSAQGGTDYVAMPLTFSDGHINTVSLASDHPDGFSTEHLGQVFKALFVLSRFYEVLVLQENQTALFDAYLGERTRQKILGGHTHRGDGENIRAAILICDLRNSTHMAGTLENNRYLGLLNDFFERATEPVISRGGEVLKFIGDAVLAIFPIEDDDADDSKAKAACIKARDAAQDIVERVSFIQTSGEVAGLRCAIGLHVGDVMYGNVGAPKRLDFTVTGTAVNIAARLADQCKTQNSRVLISGDMAHYIPENLSSLGTVSLRHVAEDVEVFAVGKVWQPG